MGTFSIILNIVTLCTVVYIFHITLASFNRREDPSVTAIQVYKSLVSGNDSVSLSNHTVGDIGTFSGYIWPSDKKSGIGGGVIMDNPIELNNRPDIPYVFTTGTT